MNENEEFDTQVERYLAGDLSAEEAAAFEAQLDSALERQVFDPEVRPLLDGARNLPKEVSPPAGLWGGIEELLRPRASVARVSGYGLRWLAAAGVVLVAAVALVYGRPQPENGPVAYTDSRPPLQEIIDWEQDFEAAEAAYRDARQTLFAELDAREVPLSEETRVTLETNVKVIDDAVREIRAAVAEDPSNPRLMQMLVATRERELDFLEILVRIPAGS